MAQLLAPDSSKDPQTKFRSNTDFSFLDALVYGKPYYDQNELADSISFLLSNDRTDSSRLLKKKYQECYFKKQEFMRKFTTVFTKTPEEYEAKNTIKRIRRRAEMNINGFVFLLSGFAVYGLKLYRNGAKVVTSTMLFPLLLAHTYNRLSRQPEIFDELPPLGSERFESER